jgi:hypothetical protein
VGRHRLSGAGEGLLEMSACDNWYGVVNFGHINVNTFISVQSASLLFCLNSITNS